MDSKELYELYRLKNIVRYNTRPKITTESVAEHSFFVSVIALELCDEYQIDDAIKQQILIKAMLHDMPEIEINDITYDAKERLKLRPYLKKYENDYDDRRFPKYSKLMKNNKGLVQAIVDLADAYSVLQYVIYEKELGNISNEMQVIYDTTMDRISVYQIKIKHLLGGRKYAKKCK